MKVRKFFRRVNKFFYKLRKASKEKGTYFVVYSCMGKLLLWTISCYYRMMLVEKSNKKGIYYFVCAVRKGIFHLLIRGYYDFIVSNGTFEMGGHTYRYFYHKYTLGNDRVVEIPIALEMLKKYSGKRILEVGNVFYYYFPVKHDILDKYDSTNGIINEDAVDFKPSEKYDLIFSISTLEHIGWDEQLRDPMKILRAIENLESCLAPGGEMLVTLPIGSNPEMDKLLKLGKIRFPIQYYLKRIREDKWEEARWEDICDTKNWYPFTASNGLVVGVVENSR
ncbi:MAG: hypothetical protein PHE49_09830 [bacterium]|nr:hypothetical protein [bacterium]